MKIKGTQTEALLKGGPDQPPAERLVAAHVRCGGQVKHPVKLRPAEAIEVRVAGDVDIVVPVRGIRR